LRCDVQRLVGRLPRSCQHPNATYAYMSPRVAGTRGPCFEPVGRVQGRTRLSLPPDNCPLSGRCPCPCRRFDAIDISWWAQPTLPSLRFKSERGVESARRQPTPDRSAMIRFLMLLMAFAVSPQVLGVEPELSVPDALKPWIPWVLGEDDRRDCPLIGALVGTGGERSCALGAGSGPDRRSVHAAVAPLRPQLGPAAGGVGPVAGAGTGE